MDAVRALLIFLSLFAFTGAKYETSNFVVTAPTEEIAVKVGKAAEIYRRDLAQFWLGKPLPRWSRPCKLRVRPGALGAGGETKFQFVGGEVINWDMYVQGSLERILDSVLPHEVNHTIFACHYRRPLPRWADEGAATLFEHRAEQKKQLALLKQVLHSDREFIALQRLLEMKQYPRDYRPMLILYAEGYALADFLVQQGGRSRFLKFLSDGERNGWSEAIRRNYHHGGVTSLEKNWKAWIEAGMPQLRTPPENMIVQTTGPDGLPRPRILSEYSSEPTIRSQSPLATARRTSRAVNDTGSSDTRSRGSAVSAKQTAQPKRTTPTVSQPSVFRGLPTTRPAPQGYRTQSLEAPSPRSMPGHRPQKNVRLPQKSRTEMQRQQSGPGHTAGLERTTITKQSNQETGGEHFPRKRRLETGSVPQWADFPGQPESF